MVERVIDVDDAGGSNPSPRTKSKTDGFRHLFLISSAVGEDLKDGVNFLAEKFTSRGRERFCLTEAKSTCDQIPHRTYIYFSNLSGIIKIGGPMNESALLREGEILSERIDRIIELIPEDFQGRQDVVSVLRAQKSSLEYSAPEQVPNRWNEIAQTLNTYLPGPDETKWATQIADVFGEKF